MQFLRRRETAVSTRTIVTAIRGDFEPASPKHIPISRRVSRCLRESVGRVTPSAFSKGPSLEEWKMKPKMSQKAACEGKDAVVTTKHLEFGDVVGLNAPKLDVRDPAHEIVATQANICSKTCNSN